MIRRIGWFKGRQIVNVRINGLWQPFYKSTGRNSGMRGRWLPFCGVLDGRWFIKGMMTPDGVKALPDRIGPFEELSKELSLRSFKGLKSLRSTTRLNKLLYIKDIVQLYHEWYQSKAELESQPGAGRDFSAL